MEQYDTGLTVWKPIGPAKQETSTHRWHAVVEEVDKRCWRASIELSTTGQVFVAEDLYNNSDQAKAWCLAQLGMRHPIILFAHLLDRPVPSRELQLHVLARLREYDLVTAHRLVGWALSRWGEVRAGVLRTIDDYREWPWLAREPMDFFWYTITKLDFSRLEPMIPAGAIRLVDELELAQEGQHWGEELAQLPVSFYVAIYSFTLAVSDWLRTCELSPILPIKPSKRARRKAIDQCLRDWQVTFSLD